MAQIPLSNESFQRIICFYLFECPVRVRKRMPKSERLTSQDKYKFCFRKVSKRGITFEERGLDGAKLNTLRAAMKRATGVTMKAVDSDVFALDAEEYIVIKKNEENTSITEGYFYCIRNAFAHGDFEVENDVYVFRNRPDDTIKGLARLKEKTLLKWIDLVSMTSEELKKVGK